MSRGAVDLKGFRWRTWVVLTQELRLIRRDPIPFLLSVAMPLALIAFAKPTLDYALRGQGYRGTNGAEQVVPGMAVLFSLFRMEGVGLSFFREQAWQTWPRLRASRLGIVEILVGKGIVLLTLNIVQLVVVFVVGVAAFDLEMSSQQVMPTAVLALALAVCTIALGLAVTSLTQNAYQLNAATTLGGLVIAGFGGAIVSVSLLPSWARHVAPVTPAYWAMRGFRTLFLDGGSTLADVILPTCMLLLIAAVAGLVAVRRFSSDEDKLLVNA